MATLFENEVIQTSPDGWVIEWTADTAVDVNPERGFACITQDDDTVLIPWCYLPDVIKALEEARDELERYRRSRP